METVVADACISICDENAFESNNFDFDFFRDAFSKYVFEVGHLKCEAYNSSNTYEVA